MRLEIFFKIGYACKIPCGGAGPFFSSKSIMKETADSIKEPLQMIFNKTFKEGTLPEVWKDAHVTALYKN